MLTEPPDEERLITCRTIFIVVVLVVIAFVVVLALLGPVIGNIYTDMGGPL